MNQQCFDWCCYALKHGCWMDKELYGAILAWNTCWFYSFMEVYSYYRINQTILNFFCCCLGLKLDVVCFFFGKTLKGFQLSIKKECLIFFSRINVINFSLYYCHSLSVYIIVIACCLIILLYFFFIEVVDSIKLWFFYISH